MCGINGIVQKTESDAAVLDFAVRSMNAHIVHRGPDEEGVFADGHCGVGMRRLSIIDLSTGSQPIFNETGQLVIVFNGEIYNYKELQKHVIQKGHVLKTASDTEVVLHLYEEYGENALNMLSGMFAFAIYDKGAKELFLARDRLGEKPLYFCHDDEGFCFSSELKSILKGLNRSYPIDCNALNVYLALTYIPAPLTIFKGVKKLLPGHWLRYDLEGLTISPYWDVRKVIPSLITDHQTALQQLQKTMSASVEAMMISDVPLGAFLSGGIDSTIVAGLMSRISEKKINTFSVGFTIPDFDETEKAMAVSQYHGTDHQVIKLDYFDALSWLDRILDNMDEPFADSSCIPTYYVSQFARNHVKVALTGDGGDEMFAGYSKYLVDYYTKMYNKIPRFMSEVFFEPAVGMLPDKNAAIRKLKKVIQSKDDDLFIQRKKLMMLGFSDLHELLVPKYLAVEPLNFIDQVYENCGIEDELTRTLYTDMKIVLEGDMLAKVDRMSMLASLETRAPFLSKEMVELAYRIPSYYKIRGRSQKIILKEAFSDLLPKGIIEQTKQGFGVPVGEWFKGPLKSTLLEELNLGRIEEQGIFRAEAVEKMLEEHFSEAENHGFRLWTLFVFQKWYNGFYKEGRA